eukprot:jgi/Chrzof1/13578/Cz08g03010.t1
MEGLLGKFQSDLGKVSDEIRQLQVQSQTMSTKLKNRRVAENKLGAFVEHMAVSEDLVSSVLDTEVSEDYLEHLLALDRKIKFITTDEMARGSQARKDLGPVLEKLRIKAIIKVRDFMLNKLYQLKKPKTNISIIQQNVLLKYKYFVRFLKEHGEDIYQELRAEYVSVLSKILSSHFRTYLSSIEKMQSVVAGQFDVLGAPEGTAGSVGSMMTSIFSKQQGKPTTEHTFQLGERVTVLSQVDKPAIIPHMAEFEGKRFPYEVVFRNVHKLLVDTASSEFLFCLDFWEDEGIFKELFAPIVAVVETDLANAVQEQHDIVCILLMININAEHRRLMSKRRVPCLDDYLDRVNLLLWPRYKVLFDVQQSSIRAGSERQLFNNDCSVHFVTKRYAALTATVLELMADHDSDDGVFKASSFQEMLERLWAAMFDLLLRMSNMFKDRRQGIIFLILNYNYIKHTLRAADTSATAQNKRSSSGGGAVGDARPSSPTAAGGLGTSGATAMKECEDQLASCMGLYVEDQLSQHFKDLVEFVKKAEQTQKRLAVAEGAPIPGLGPREASPVLRDFSVRWKQAVDTMHKEVARQFPEATCGREVLQASMTQLLLYYTRMLELLKKQGPDGMALTREAVNIPAIMYEIKRITKS